MTPHLGIFHPTARSGADPTGPPADFGDPAAEYQAARTAAALFSRRTRALLRLSGADALDLLHRTTTAELNSLPVGGAASTVVQTETAHVVDWLTVIRRSDDLVVVGGPGRGAELAAWIDRLVIMEDVQIESIEERSDLFELVGPEGVAALTSAYGGAVAALAAAAPEAGRGRVALPAPGVTFVRGFEENPDAVLILLDREADRAPLERLLVEGRVVPAGATADEALRVESGRPLVGRELDGGANPLEARLEPSVSLTKGCYPGQEVVARLITYKSLKRRLTLFALDREVPAPPTGSPYVAVDGGAPAGRLTSVVRSPARGVPVALGYLRNDLAVPGTEIIFTAADGPVRGRVLDFPPAP